MSDSSSRQSTTGYNCFTLRLGFSSLSFLFCLHCHSSSTGMKCHRSKSGQKHLRKTMGVFWWHCQSIKSLNRSTPLVRTNSSNGGQPSVYMWLSIVSAVMSSALG